MNLDRHFIVSLLLAIVFFPVFGVYSLLALVGGFLIDFDHFLWFVVNKKSFSLKKAYHFFTHTHFKDYYMTLIFHSAEFGALVLLFTYYYQWFFPFLLGYLVHMSMDLYVYFTHRKQTPRPIAYFLVHKLWLRFFKKKKKSKK